GDHVRSWDVAVIHHDELGPVDVFAEAHGGDAAAWRRAPYGHAPQEAVEREIVDVLLAARELGECLATSHGANSVALLCSRPGRNVADLEHDVGGHRQWRAVRAHRRAAAVAVRFSPERAGPHGHARGMRARGMWRVHGAAG